MNYRPEQVDQLAAEYVVGTLIGRARQRFETLMSTRADLRHAVWQWEQLLHGLYATLEPVRPPASVWRSIHRRIEGRGSSISPGPRLAPWAAIAACLVAVVTWIGLDYRADLRQPDRIAVFTDTGNRALWVVSFDEASGKLFAETSGVAIADDRVHELWALPQDGNPLSLGLLDTAAGRSERVLTPDRLAALARSTGLAISLEPPGGSASGAPTGPVVYQAKLLEL